MIGELGENLVFLLGLPRSGTTLLSVLMNQHPNVHCPSEPWLMLALEALGRTPDSDPSDAAVLYHAMEEFLTGELPIQAARAYARTAYNAKLAEAGKTIFVDKTPRYYLILPFIHRVFPKARYVLLQRDPMDVAASMKQTWKFDLRREFELKQDALGSVDLNYGLRKLMTFACDSAHPAFFVRYEELVKDARSKMIDVFTNIGADPALAPAELNFDVGASGFAKSAVGDRKILDTKGPHQKSIGGWKRAFEPAEAGVIVNAIGPGMMRDLGYGATLQDAAAMGIELLPESHALEHFDRLHKAVMTRVHKYTACASFAELLPARMSLEAELGGELPLDPLARVRMLTDRARQLKQAAANVPGSHAMEFAVAMQTVEKRHAAEVEQLKQQLSAERQRGEKLAKLLGAAADEMTAFQRDADEALSHAANQTDYWIGRSKELSDRLRHLIAQWPLKAAWKLRLQAMPAWAPQENQPLQAAYTRRSMPRRLEEWARQAKPLIDHGDHMAEALWHLMAKGFRPKVVLDIGAAKGYWSETCQYLYFSDADYYMVDPLQQSEQHLSELAARNKQFHYLLMAIGSTPGEVQMSVGNDPDASSLLSFGKQSKTATVPVETVDRLIEQGKVAPPQLVKIDVQGFEIEVLKGGHKMFDTAEVIIIEVNLYEFMQGTPLADKVVTYMANHGYRIYDIADTLRRPYQNDLAQMDLVFVKAGSALVSSNQWK